MRRGRATRVVYGATQPPTAGTVVVTPQTLEFGTGDITATASSFMYGTREQRCYEMGTPR